jgi:membrane-bound lytic murein transglycosylase D
MQVTSSIDERRDPIIATRAAAKYLKNSYNKLGEWPLAVTSYNHGLQGVLNAVNQTGSKDLATIIRKYNGKSFGFASSNFYPSFLAALDVEQRAERFFPGLKREQPWRFDEVRLGRSIGISDLAKKSNTSRGELERLNLAFRKSILSGSARIPAGSVVKVDFGGGRKLASAVAGSSVMPLHGGEIRLADAPPPPTKSATVIVARGAEPVRSVPIRGAGTNENSEPEKTEVYQVKKGDTVSEIAERFDVPRSELLAANNISNAGNIRIGEKIAIPVGAAGAEEAEPEAVVPAEVPQPSNVTGKPVRQTYQVQPGDTIGKIGRKFSISQSNLMKLNGIRDARRLRIGAELIVNDGESTVVAEAARAAEGSESSVPLKEEEPQRRAAPNAYLVVKGDSLYTIAKRYQTSVQRLRKLNPGVTKKIKPGQKLIVE